MEDDPRLPVLVGTVTPHVEVSFGLRMATSGRLEPGVLVGCVVDDQLGDHPQPQAVGLAELTKSSMVPYAGWTLV